MSYYLRPLEWAVFALSCADRVSRLGPASAKRGWILGLPTGPLPLANPRLEALRRYAILRRVYGADRARSEREQLCETGFSDRKIEEIDDLVDPARRHRRAPSGTSESLFIFDGSCFSPVRWN